LLWPAYTEYLSASANKTSALRGIPAKIVSVARRECTLCPGRGVRREKTETRVKMIIKAAKTGVRFEYVIVRLLIKFHWGEIKVVLITAESRRQTS
jgi:hypothetical protein